ncbi:MAG: tetratricopeptide repeat protein [Verrucomicrobiota bacterium]
MIPRRSLLTVIGAAVFLFAASVVFASPQDQYLQIYLLIQEGEKLETSGQKAEAKERFDVSLKRLEDLQKEYPDWEPVIVRYRINFCKDKVQNLQGLVVEETPAESTTPQLTTSTTMQTSVAQETTPLEPKSTPSLITPRESVGQEETGIDSSEIALLKARIRELESELEETKLKLTTATTEGSGLRAQQQILESQIESLRQGVSDAKLNEVMEQNKLLQEQLSKAQTEIDRLQQGAASAASIQALQEELTKSQEQIAALNKQKDFLQQSNDQFRKQLQEAQDKLAAAAKSGSASLQRENKILRDLVSRQLKEQNRREAARKTALQEIERLAINSATLKTQIDILASPPVTLTAEEREIMQSLKASLSVDTQGNISTTIERPAADYASSPRVPSEYRDVAEQAVQLFANRKFEEAAAKYQTILNAYPGSLYALSNLGVVRFQQQKYADAEKTLKEAVRLAPQDAFSHSILGIVLYQQGKYDDAVQVLSRAVALNPNDPKTRNYLGISASQKGWQEAAEQECRTAIELDPNYGDAHFNLAVIYATQNPPAKELAKKHYQQAIKLGIPKDDQLEKLLN